MTIAYRAPDTLRPHPLNERLYDTDRDADELAASVAANGILTPLTIDQDGTILSGHRRWRAATALALDSVSVIVREIDDPLEAERILIESNRQRKKTASEAMREAEQSERIVAEENRRRMLAGVGEENPRVTLREGRQRTDTAVAEGVGMKESTYRKTKKVFDAAKDNAPESVRTVARQQMAALDAGETTPHEAERAVRKAKQQAEAAPEQQQAAHFAAFLNRNGALDRGALRVGYFEAKAKANKHLLSLDPTRIPDGLRSEDIDGAREFAQRLAAWGTAFERALPRGLRVLRAE